MSINQADNGDAQRRAKPRHRARRQRAPERDVGFRDEEMVSYRSRELHCGVLDIDQADAAVS